MGGFKDGVSALLDSYTKCLELLKTPVLKGQGDPDAPSRSDARSRLRASMRSDRVQIRQAYASNLSVSGSRLDEGDTRSRSAIRRILDRIRTAMQPLLAKPGPAAADYGSLASLSSTWRSDALRTMEQLSQRLSLDASSPRGRRASNAVSTGGIEHKTRRAPSTPRKTPKRSSFATTSSDSTQLGEVPHQAARRHRHSAAGSDGSYGTSPVYPLYAYGPTPKKRSFLRRLLSNGR